MRTLQKRKPGHVGDFIDCLFSFVNYENIEDFILGPDLSPRCQIAKWSSHDKGVDATPHLV